MDGWMEWTRNPVCHACFSRNVQNPDGISSTISRIRSSAIGRQEEQCDVVRPVWQTQTADGASERAKCKRNKLHVTLHGEESPERRRGREERGERGMNLQHVASLPALFPPIGNDRPSQSRSERTNSSSRFTLPDRREERGERSEERTT